MAHRSGNPTWVDYPSTSTLVSAARLEAIENGIDTSARKDAATFNVLDYGATGNGTTDDTAAIQSAINAADSAGGGRVYLPAGTYIVGGALQNTTGANAQLVLPDRNYGAAAEIVITIEGAFPAPTTYSVTGTTPTPSSGTVIKSTLNAGTGGAVFGAYSATGTGNFTNIFAVFKNLTVRLPANPVLTALNMSLAGQFEIDGVDIDAGSYYVGGLVQMTTSTSYGVRLPKLNNGAYTRIGSLGVTGFYNGVEAGEHMNAEQLTLYGNYQALVIPGVNYHAMKIQRLNIHHSTYGIVFTGAASRLDVDQFNVEHASSGWQMTTADILDTGNFGYGVIRWNSVAAGVGTSSTFTVSGGTNLRVYRMDDALGGGGSAVYKGRDRLVAAAGNNTLTLGATPVANSPLVWVNNVIKWPGTDYTISGSVITFGSALSASDVVLDFYDTLTSSPGAASLSTASAGIADTFTRADSTSSLGSTTTGAAAWTAHSGTWGISTNAAYVSTGTASSACLASVPSAVTDCTVQVTVSAVTGTEQGGLYFRATDASNGYIFETGHSAAPAKLYKWVAGAATMIGQSTGNLAAVAGDVYAAVMSGTSITIKRNGTAIITVTDSTYTTQTRHGLYVVASGASPSYRLDDFSIA